MERTKHHTLGTRLVHGPDGPKGKEDTSAAGTGLGAKLKDVNLGKAECIQEAGHRI